MMSQYLKHCGIKEDSKVQEMFEKVTTTKDKLPQQDDTGDGKAVGSETPVA